jgi:hypothetical protein
LGEIYEEDYIKQTTGDMTNEKDEALKKEHKEIENIFKDLCHKLDALSNFHYTPKPVSLYMLIFFLTLGFFATNLFIIIISLNRKLLLLLMCPQFQWRKLYLLMLAMLNY